MNRLQELFDASKTDFAALEAEMIAETAATPKELIYARDTLRLYHYLPQTEDIYRVPLMLVMSPVSKPYIFDLAKGQSLIEFLVREGFDIYLVDWGEARAEHAGVDVADYVADWIPDCIGRIQAHSGEEDITLLGYCLGGIFTSLYAALEPNGPLKNLLQIATPINGEGMELQRKLVTSDGLDVDKMIDTLGNVPANMIEAAFQIMRPLQKRSGQLMLLNHLDDREFVKAHLRMTRWGADALPFPGAAFRTLVRDFVIGNKIVKGEFEINGRALNLADIRAPMMHLQAEHDHVVPIASSRDLIRLAGAEDKEEMVIKGGHVSLVTGARAAKRTWPHLVNWLAPRSV